MNQQSRTLGIPRRLSMPSSSQRYGGNQVDRQVVPQSPSYSSSMYASQSLGSNDLEPCSSRVPYQDNTPCLLPSPTMAAFTPQQSMLTPREVLGVPDGARYPTVPIYSRNEFVCTFDSANRDTDQFPEPNGFLYAIQLANENFVIHSVSLGTMELPLSQFNVEEENSRVYFDEGYVFPVVDQPTNITRVMTLSNTDRGETEDLTIPAHVNPILSAVNLGGGVWQITTEFEHGLECLAIWDWELPRLSGQPVDAQLVTLSPFNVTIVDDFTFNFQTTASTILSGPGTAVYFPRYPSPQHVADAMNHLISRSDKDWVRQTSFTVKNSSLSVVLINNGTENVIPRSDGPNFQLSQLLGYQPCGCSGQISLPPSLKLICPDLPKITDPRFLWQTRDQQNMCRNEVLAKFPSSCQTFVRVPPSNYSPESLRTELETQFNRFYFRIAPDLVSTQYSSFVFRDSLGNLQPIQIPAGQWTPQDLALFLTERMSALDTGADYEVTTERNPTNNLMVFAFRSLNGQHFSLEFGPSPDSSTPDIPVRLGFDSVPLRNRSLYRSNKPFVVPALGCCLSDGTPLVARGPRNTYAVQVDTSKKTFTISASRPPPLIANVTSVVGDIVTLTLVPPSPNANSGFKIGDVIRMVARIATPPINVGDILTAKVDDITNSVPGTFADVIRITFPAGHINVGDQFLVSHDPDPNFSLYLPAPLGQTGTTPYTDSSASVRAELLGFTPGAIMPNRPAPFTIGCVGKCRSGGCPQTPTVPPNADPTTGYTSNQSYNLQHPNYLLVELEVDNASNNIQHRWANDVKHTLLAKIICYPEIRVERVVPMVITFPTSNFIKGFGIKVLNPDHTPYRFHGRDWSGTLVFTCL